ncbi:ribosomal protein L11 methyltransferase [Desulfocicer vacuolatum DSM 3385]|uniref:Ribosomal protein L11 methyltransferase n=1 Tax=Desulfocicer vacuolatum DSM 3385 TaxID=1121400 RepID=A0A1W1YNJ4_9BACT|nr:50S ribosomal protein L11 methyltransferase [Desulfocicer vacuolatum]SMC37713.1 ribosomal protein L11 methyltransferase [Desulfocicer vacuolatum DSM 3385]
MSNPYEYLYIYYLEGIPSSLDPAIKESTFIGNWEEDGFSFLFFSYPHDDLINEMVAREDHLSLIDKYEMTSDQWHGDKIESYTAGSLVISPPWKIPFVNQRNLTHILLDPGVVFGTGRHQTTEDCLGYMEYLCRKEKISTVVDIGTGTGILALGAAALGCDRVLALDFNLLAVRTTLNNIRLNDFHDRILAIQARGEAFMAVPAQLVVANIHYDVMKILIEAPEFVEKPWLILSGLLKSEADKVCERLKEKSVTLVERISPDGVWNTLLVQGRSVPTI